MHGVPAIPAASHAARDFSVDLDKMYSILLADHGRSLSRRIGLWIQSSELHCVAAYRFGVYADALRRGRPVRGALLTLLHRLWNRWNTHLHHCDISRHARIGPGLLLMHRHGVLIGPTAIGKNAVIHHNVTIGQRVAKGDHGVPTIGDDVWIGPGAVVTGDIRVGDGVTISAGSVVSRDIPDRSLVAGNPGRVIASDYDNRALVNFVIPAATPLAPVSPDDAPVSREDEAPGRRTAAP